MSNQPQQLPLSLDIVYDLARERLRIQLDEVESANRKLELIFGSSSVILGLVVAFLNAREDPVPLWGTLAYGGSAITYVAIFVLAVLAYRALSVQFPPNVPVVWEEALFWPQDVTKRTVLAQMVKAIEINRELIAAKVKLTQVAMYLIPLEVILALVGTVLLYFFG